MDLEGIMLSENKSDRERQILYDLTYMWNLQGKKVAYREQIGGWWWQEVGGVK